MGRHNEEKGEKREEEEEREGEKKGEREGGREEEEEKGGGGQEGKEAEEREGRGRKKGKEWWEMDRVEKWHFIVSEEIMSHTDKSRRLKKKKSRLSFMDQSIKSYYFLFLIAFTKMTPMIPKH